MGERPAKAVHTVLSAAAALSGETIRIGRPQDSPDRGIWCWGTGGFAAVEISGEDEDLEQPTVQVFVRVEKGDGEDLETLAYAVRDALNHSEPTDYTTVRVPRHPIFLQDDARGRPRASINAELVIIE